MALIEYVALVILGGLVLAWEAWAPGQPGVEPLTLLFWVLANMLGELLWLPTPKERGYLSMATAANFATLLILPVSLAVTTTVLAGALVDLMFRHRRWYQVLFNASVCCIAVFSASHVFTSVGQGRDGLENLLTAQRRRARALGADVLPGEHMARDGGRGARSEVEAVRRVGHDLRLAPGSLGLLRPLHL